MLREFQTKLQKLSSRPILGVLATLKITGARCSYEYQLFVDPKSKMLQKLDQNGRS